MLLDKKKEKELKKKKINSVSHLLEGQFVLLLLLSCSHSIVYL